MDRISAYQISCVWPPSIKNEFVLFFLAKLVQFGISGHCCTIVSNLHAVQAVDSNDKCSLYSRISAKHYEQLMLRFFKIYRNGY